MDKIGIVRRSKKQQAIAAELESIIEEFGCAMRDADKPYIATYQPACGHEAQLPFTLHMKIVFARYRQWCREHRDE